VSMVRQVRRETVGKLTRINTRGYDIADAISIFGADFLIKNLNCLQFLYSSPLVLCKIYAILRISNRNRAVMVSLILGALIMLYMPREEGQGLVEYALILVLVAVVVIVILALVGPAIGNIFSNIVNTL
jgi:pilus assembly protein Flp/PilA